jgi:hypothetical protein
LNSLRRLACIVLAAAGVFILYLYALVYSGGGGLPPLPVTAIADLGVLCLLIASRMVLTSYVDAGSPVPGPRRGNRASLLGIVLTLSALFIIFPVGCNISNGCSMSPEGTWSTIWPNTLMLILGFVLAAWGWGASRSRRLSLPSLGIGMIPGGLVVLMLALRTGYTTFCPANGCLPLTAREWWSLYLPNVIAGSLGVLLIAIGSLLVLLRWPRIGQAASLTEAQ